MSSKGNPSVDAFLESLAHTRLATIQRLREVILGSGSGLTEAIKWNAPSYVHDGEHRLTMRLQPRSIIQLIFHRGAKPRVPVDLTSVDPTGRIKWPATDRGVLEFSDEDVLLDNPEVLHALIRSWLVATEEAERMAADLRSEA